MDLNLRGKKCLITGGSHGIGFSIAISLAKEGCDIVFVSRGRRYDVETAKTEIMKYGNCVAIEGDITDPSVFDSLDLTSIDILINNVGGGSSWGDVLEWHKTSEKTWLDVFNQNIHVSVRLINKVLPTMITRKFGRIITISSVYGFENGGMPWFQSAKSAQISFMKSYSSNSSYVKHNVTFNTICPGFIDMPDKQHDSNLIEKIPVGKFGRPDDVSNIVTFLCSPQTSFINGATIPVDGGQTQTL